VLVQAATTARDPVGEEALLAGRRPALRRTKEFWARNRGKRGMDLKTEEGD
jgi:hypothetical protein